ncbi:AzlD domain-containing protein [Polymorphospora rubra]|uniref:Branched-chain amino acid ABC transporter n=1 Tax=Polymorphospora rubra TaxID=338584 RepID=A0A810NDU8_9ACTN|nr:AzlD domain-containing protein [Polymorphospora rubra]BCJ70068.1 hypothetical protein Prubr_70890 [Polymorphospora rubra]
MTLWLAIIAVAAVSFTFKAIGPALLGDRELPPAARNVIALLAPALLAGLIVVEVLGPKWTGIDWTLLVGLAATAAAWAWRAPMLLAVLVGVVATALARQLPF